MVMDSPFKDLLDPVNGFKLDDGMVLPSFEELPANGLKDDHLNLNTNFPFVAPSPDPGSFAPSSSLSTEADSPDDHEDPVLKYLNQILLEENIEDKPSMFYDPLALQTAEESFYDIIGEKPQSPSTLFPSVDQKVENGKSVSGSSGDYNTSSSTTGSYVIEPQWNIGNGSHKPYIGQNNRLDDSIPTNSVLSFGSVNSFSNGGPHGHVDSLFNPNIVQNIFSDRESILQFKRGMEEASKFLPTGKPLMIDLDKYALPPKTDERINEVLLNEEKNHLSDGSRGRKHAHQEDSDSEEGRSSKQSASYVEDVELPEMFDRVLLCTDANGNPMSCQDDAELPNGDDKTLNLIEQTSGRMRVRKTGPESEAVDLRTLLISCAQSVAVDDRKTANEQLKQIRQHSCNAGDAYHRLAYTFANGLEARMAGTGTQLYAALAPKKISATEKLKAYQLYISACPFKKISIFFANKMIVDTAAKATTLHVVDFGILYGFQWPNLIQLLSDRPGGPPKLRITGIELPQPGFRPAERIEETGRRLAKYCERFNVQFEYNAIAAQDWETIKIEDLKITRNEVLAVNCLFRFKNLFDETVLVESPRDAVLKLIRKMKPDIFVHAITNGSYGAPFFLTRFKEALFHYSALFEMFDATIPRESQERMNFEQDFFGRESMNVIACEGLERVERPETYKQWQSRTMRAGFKLLPLDQWLIKKLRGKAKAGYHKDFVFDEDGYWMMQGWKGRIICASSCWVPA